MDAAVTKRRTRLAPEERRSLILDSAAEMIAQGGIAALTMDAIGRAAGVSKSLVYNYFPNLQMLMSELLERELKRLRRLQREAIGAADTFEGMVRATTHVYLSYIEERGLIIERLQQEPSVSDHHDPTEYGRDAAVEFLAQIVERHFDLPPEVARAATDISFGLPASAGAYLLRTGMDRQRLEDITVAMILGSITSLKTDFAARRKPLWDGLAAERQAEERPTSERSTGPRR
ncbi:TetR/AcrR family transcriptional regulator [Erythrobacter sp. NE805]|uniref:TetR/AcrR family transcriptional regulator n=1 Tax=Erythrobacter sp. NE805 TaxID=3389875 RepID=UPI00396B2A8A